MLPGTLATVLLGALLLGGCTPKITQEQLQRLRELRAQERQLTQDIQRKEADKGRLQREISTRQGELGQCQDKKRFVQEKLAAWPNVWPDYTPPSAQDTGAAPGVEVRTRKKPR
jgi:outer membrane murein-binding lipoprotein Lpp